MYTSVQSKNRSANRSILSSYYIVSFWLNKKLVIFGEVNKDTYLYFLQLKDNVAMVEFFYWLKNEVSKCEVSILTYEY